MVEGNECFCGSGQPQIAYYDARGIFLTFGCDICWPTKAKTYRPDVLSDPNYWHDEPLDGE